MKSKLAANEGAIAKDAGSKDSNTRSSITRGSILVTGASRGIGAAIAEALAEAGYQVGCVSRSGDLPARPGASAIARSRWVALKADVTDAAQLRAAFDAFAAQAGPAGSLVGLVNNAGVHVDAPSAQMPRQQWDQVMDTNAWSVVAGCQAAYPHLAAAGGALIVNIGSFFDKIGVRRNLAYCTSKAAVGAITRVLAVEWASKNIRVIDVAPGYIATDLNRESMSAGPLREYLEKRIPGRAPGTSEDVGRLVAALFAIGSPFLTGETIYIDGAQGVAH
jgi:NAD(P)-dependent dehydrogenase (short-subunit alcohol dehydrogenase family)